LPFPVNLESSDPPFLASFSPAFIPTNFCFFFIRPKDALLNRRTPNVLPVPPFWVPPTPRRPRSCNHSPPFLKKPTTRSGFRLPSPPFRFLPSCRSSLARISFPFQIMREFYAGGLLFFFRRHKALPLFEGLPFFFFFSNRSASIYLTLSPLVRVGLNFDFH